MVLNNIFQIIKIDNVKKTSTVWHEKNCYASEPIFVQSPNAIVSKKQKGFITNELIFIFFRMKMMVFYYLLSLKDFRTQMTLVC